MSKRDHLPRLRQLLQQYRWAALATVDEENNPEASMVAYAIDEEKGNVYLHLSTLAGHTRNLARHPQASLVITQADDNAGDPQQLPRATLAGQVSVIDRASEGYESARQRYLQRLPDAEPLFSFGDFRLFCLRIEKIRYVGGFAQAHSYSPEELKQG